MTTPRYTQIDYNATPYYHCVSRCVRRAYLYGEDPVTHIDYSYRKEMVLERLKELASIFMIDICAYAVMSNHTHLVLYVNLPLAQSCDDTEIRHRWSMLYPNAYQEFAHQEANLTAPQIALIINSWRQQLCSISTFMGCLNQFIARRCNIEDNCTGRFWEGRFKSQALLDDAALLSAMAYVDLNPIRANIATTPEQSEFTSIFERIKYLKRELEEVKQEEISPEVVNQTQQPPSLVTLGMPSATQHYIDFKLADYLQLVDTTGRILREDKRGKIPAELNPILERLQLTSVGWFALVSNPMKDFSRAIGHCDKLRLFNQGKTKNIRGVTRAKQYYQLAA